MFNTIASQKPSNHTRMEMNQQTNRPTSSLTNLSPTQEQYIEACFPTARRNAATVMNCLFSLGQLRHSYQFLHIKGTALQQKLKVLSVGYNFNYKIITLFIYQL